MSASRQALLDAIELVEALRPFESTNVRTQHLGEAFSVAMRLAEDCARVYVEQNGKVDP